MIINACSMAHLVMIIIAAAAWHIIIVIDIITAAAWHFTINIIAVAVSHITVTIIAAAAWHIYFQYYCCCVAAWHIYYVFFRCCVMVYHCHYCYNIAAGGHGTSLQLVLLLYPNTFILFSFSLQHGTFKLSYHCSRFCGLTCHDLYYYHDCCLV